MFQVTLEGTDRLLGLATDAFRRSLAAQEGIGFAADQEGAGVVARRARGDFGVGARGRSAFGLALIFDAHFASDLVETQ